MNIINLIPKAKIIVEILLSLMQFVTNVKANIVSMKPIVKQKYSHIKPFFTRFTKCGNKFSNSSYMLCIFFFSWNILFLVVKASFVSNCFFSLTCELV